MIYTLPILETHGPGAEQVSRTMHSDKISHLTSTLLTCLQIIKHNIAYMSAVGAEYADVYFAT